MNLEILSVDERQKLKEYINSVKEIKKEIKKIIEKTTDKSGGNKSRGLILKQE